MRAPLALSCLALAGCGSAAVGELPGAAEPRRSPAPAVAPAGRTVTVTGGPEGLAFDPASGTLAVGLRDPPGVALVDGATGRVRLRVPLAAGPRHMAAGNGVFYVPAEKASRLFGIRARDGRVLWDVGPGAYPHGVAATSDGVIAAAERGSEIAFVHAGHITGRTPVARQPGGVAVVDGGRQVAVVSVRARILELYATRPPYRRLAGVPAGVGPTHIVAQGDWAWVADTQGDALLYFRVRPRLELVRHIRLAGGPYGIALDPVRHRLWVTLTATNRIVELAAQGRPKVIADLPSVRQADDLAVDSRTGRVFVGSRTDDLVEIIDPR